MLFTWKSKTKLKLCDLVWFETCLFIYLFIIYFDGEKTRTLGCSQVLGKRPRKSCALCLAAANRLLTYDFCLLCRRGLTWGPFLCLMKGESEPLFYLLPKMKFLKFYSEGEFRVGYSLANLLSPSVLLSFSKFMSLCSFSEDKGMHYNILLLKLII